MAALLRRLRRQLVRLLVSTPKTPKAKRPHEQPMESDAPGEAALRWVLRQRLPPGGVMFDVGANVGELTALAAQLVTATGHVYAFEPGPDNVARLRERFKTATNVTIVAAAVSHSAGEATLFMDRRDTRRHSLAAQNVGKAGKAEVVAQVALDAYRQAVTRLDVIKIDAQGAEPHILNGARGLLESFRPALVFELWPYGLRNLDVDPSALLDQLRTFGYDLYRLSPDGKLKDARHVEAILPTTKRWKKINVVALPKTSR